MQTILHGELRKLGWDVYVCPETECFWYHRRSDDEWTWSIGVAIMHCLQAFQSSLQGQATTLPAMEESLSSTQQVPTLSVSVGHAGCCQGLDAGC